MLNNEKKRVMTKNDMEWVTVPQYAKMVGKSRSQIYLDIRLGKIPKKQFRQIKKVVTRLQIKVDKST
jgi:predicted DNA-binding transcriptional regulator AlpA